MRNGRLKILIDKSVLIDFFLDNDPLSECSKKILYLCHNGEIDGVVDAASLVDLFYVLKNKMPDSECKYAMNLLLRILSVSNLDKRKFIDVLSKGGLGDLLENLQVQSAKTENANYIVASDAADDSYSEISILSSDEFLRLFENAAKNQKILDNARKSNSLSHGFDDWQMRSRASAYGL